MSTVVIKPVGRNSPAASPTGVSEYEQAVDVLNELGRPPRRSSASQAAAARAATSLDDRDGNISGSVAQGSIGASRIATDCGKVEDDFDGLEAKFVSTSGRFTTEAGDLTAGGTSAAPWSGVPSATGTRAPDTAAQVDASSEAEVVSSRTATAVTTSRTGIAHGDNAWATSARTGINTSARSVPFQSGGTSVGGAASIALGGANSPSARSRVSGMAVAAARALKAETPRSSGCGGGNGDVPSGFRCAVCDLEFAAQYPPGHCTACSQDHGGWLCKSCFSAHCRSMFPNHVASLAEDRLTSERSAVLSELGVRVPPAAACQLHITALNPALSLYCTVHHELVCAECVSQQHAGPGHEFVAATFAAAKCR
jgi:hypothetical protein